MISTKPRSQAVQITGWEIPEYIDPAGPRMRPWPRPYVISNFICESENLDPATLCFFQQPDDSMRYTVRAGGLVMIDTADVLLRDNHKYLIEHRAGARVRRAFVQHDGSVQLSPDTLDPMYRVEIVPKEMVDSLVVIGRVRVFVGFVP